MERIVDLNENKHRYYFTREATQKELESKFKVSVKTIGKYYPNRAMATAACPPLCIQVSGDPEAVSSACDFITGVLTNGPPSGSLNATTGANKKITRKVYLPFVPEPGRAATVRQHILGPPPAASHLTWIGRQAGPGTFVGLRGQGSGYVEPGMSLEQLAEPMHILIVGQEEDEVTRAVTLAEDLMLVVQHCYLNKVKPW